MDNDINDIIAKYVFIKSASEDYMEKRAFGLTDFGNIVGGAISGATKGGTEILKFLKNLYLEQFPIAAGATGLGAGGLWWLMNRDQEKERIKSLHRNKPLDDAIKELESEGYGNVPRR